MNAPRRSMPFSTVTFEITTPEGLENLIRWLVGHRKRLRLTQAQVAARMGITPTMISRLENMRIDARLSTLQRYVRALELSPHVWADQDDDRELA